MKTIEAKTFEMDLEFDGAPVKLYVRLFIDEGRVLGVRRLKLRAPDGDLPTFNVGVVDFNDDGSPMPHSLKPSMELD